MALLKGVLFDLNNVAEDYLGFEEEIDGVVARTVASGCRLLGVSSTDAVLVQARNYMRAFAPVPLQHHPALWQYAFEEAMGRRLSYHEISSLYGAFLDEYEATIGIYPDFVETVRRCRSRDLKTGVVANGNQRRIYRFLDKFSLLGELDTVVCSGGTPFQKPSTSIFALALRNIGALPAEVAFVGDRIDTDVAGANRTGMWSVRLLRGRARHATPGSDDEEADFTVESLAALSALPLFEYADRVRDAVIPCGGRGSRMGDVTSTRQKCMLEVWGRPILAHVVDLLVASGVRDIHFLVGHRQEDVRGYFGDGGELGFRAHYHVPGAESTGDALLAVRNCLPPRFYYSHGNIVLPADVLWRVTKAFFRGGGRSTFAVTSRPVAPTHPCFDVRDGAVVDIVRKSAEVQYLPAYSIGLSLIDLGILGKGPASRSGEVTVEQLFADSVQAVSLVHYDGTWEHLESVDDLERLSRQRQGEAVDA